MTTRNDISKEDVIKIISKLWDPLTKAQQSLLLENMKIKKCKKNDVIYKGSGSPREMMCLIVGKVKIYKDGVSGRNQIIRAIKPFDFFGYRAYFAGEDYRTSAMAIDTCTVAFFPIHLIVDMMKENAFFINVSRGDVVEEADLVEALTTKRIRGASLDVFTTEPLPEDSPLWDVPNLFITPHHSAISPMYLDRSLKIFRNNLQIFPQRIGMLNVVDKQRGY